MAESKVKSCRERSQQHTFDWLRFVRDKRCSRREKIKLLACFGQPDEVYRSSKQAIALALNKDEFEWDLESKAKFDDDLKWLDDPINQLVTVQDKEFPNCLHDIDDGPFALFAKGNLDLLDTPTVSIVGSRKPTPLGAEAIKRISAELSQCMVTVVSGLAYGIDGIAHSSALQHAGKCIAVMGCGLDIVYPSGHRRLFDQILAEDGLIISEYPIGVRPTRYTFPERNRIVSGLGDGVLIAEAALNSGTMITASFACDQGKTLLVLPGSVLSSQYTGSHKLIQEGAALVTSAKEVIEAVSPQWSLDLYLQSKHDLVQEGEGSKVQKEILSMLGYSPQSIDSLKKNTSLTTAELSAMLLEMELLGLVQKDQHGDFISTM